MPLDFEGPLLELEGRIRELELSAQDKELDLSAELGALHRRLEGLRTETFSRLTRWQRVQLARAPGRPTSLDYISRVFSGFTELHGDRALSDDPAIVGGLARLGGRPLVVVGQQKGRDTKENIARNFGMAHPEGFRKAMRLMDLAEKFRLPFVSFIDTPGAYPGVAAEERGQAWLIAASIQHMTRLTVPAVAVVIGEGGSGGALALGVANRVLILENAVYSVISPESGAAILWRDAKEAEKAAEALKLTARDLLPLAVVDEIVPEPDGGAHTDHDASAAFLGAALERHLADLERMGPAAVLEDRASRFRRLGVFEEVG